VLPVPEADVAEARRLYLARHADSKQWVDYKDFSFYQMTVLDVYYVGGFGVMGWVPAAEYYGARSIFFFLLPCGMPPPETAIRS
jgi:hypothetical protein